MDPMRFAARDLKPYGEYVLAADLVQGKTYFRLSFLDHEMTVPELVPLVFIGRNVRPEHPGLYFQDVASHASGEDHPLDGWEEIESLADLPAAAWKRGACRFDMMPDGKYSNVFEFEKALDRLLACSLRRQKLSSGEQPRDRGAAEQGDEADER